jgi:hypothetical protein
MQHPRTTVAVALSLVLGCAPALAADAPSGQRSPAAAKRAPAKPAAKPAPTTAAKPKAASMQAKAKRATPAAPVAKAAPAAKPAVKAPTRTAVAARSARSAEQQASAAPRVYLPPLGPERFYPNGIPELRPEFLHPLPDAQAAQRREQALRDAAAEDRQAWFASPQ